ncbi:hypothetical protein BP5796_07328 [Coleophoma crateriformis]|uniref:C2H2-type domain-containing protein n=1 Tax=Coleophoma crateriformis TaxID=565419 RepID=A0A3D8RIV1_9HELO|nr:hypothetical protein BP5796_07328 [Coleophoma crateriformis]
MAFNMDTVDSLMLLLTWTCLARFFVWYGHSIFAKVLSSQAIVAELFQSTSLVFAPGLLDAVQASTPPTVAYFKSLPVLRKKKVWAVYLLVLEKPNCKAKFYIGSGTDALNGASVRLKNLRQQGTATHGLLCTTPIPRAALVPIVRMFIVALEAAFTYIFWAVRCKNDNGKSYVHLYICPWDHATLEYDGLCSHNPLSEVPPGDHELSAEQLEAQAAELKQNRADYISEWREKTKKNKPDEYYAKANKNRKLYIQRNPEAAKAATKRAKRKAVKQKSHYCFVCRHPFNTSAALTRHVAGVRHANRVAKAAGLPLAKPYRCDICPKDFNRRCDLTRHNNVKHSSSGLHAAVAAVARLASS